MVLSAAMVRIIFVLLLLASVRDAVAQPRPRDPVWILPKAAWILTLEDGGNIVRTDWSPTSSCVAVATETTVHIVDASGHPLWKWNYHETNRLIKVREFIPLGVSPKCDAVVIPGWTDYKYVWAADRWERRTFVKTDGTPLLAKFDLRGDTIAVVTGASAGYLFSPRLDVSWSGKLRDLPVKWPTQVVDPGGTRATDFSHDDVEALFGALMWGWGVSDDVSDDGQWRVAWSIPVRGPISMPVEFWGPGAGGYRGRYGTTGNRPRWVKRMGCPSAAITRDGSLVVATGDPDHPEAFNVGDSPACDSGDLSTFVFDQDGNTVLTWPHAGDHSEMAEAVFSRTGRRLSFRDQSRSWDVSAEAGETSPETQRQRSYSPDGKMVLARRGHELRLYRGPD
jgi:hypothetical protein